MARIRSVHPALFTDEAWVSCSPLARLLFIGLWTDADDGGAFEWKALQIKMRIFPADDLTIEPLLDELRSHDLIRPFPGAGRTLGAIKDFLKYQSPKKPTVRFPIPEDLAAFVRGDADEQADLFGGGGAVRNQSGTSSPRRGEEGRGKGEEGSRSARVAGSLPDDFPTADLIEAAAAKFEAEGVRVNATREAQRFRDHHLSKGKTFKDWAAAWRTWTSNAIDFATRDGNVISLADRAPADPGFQLRVWRTWAQDWLDHPLQWREHERGPRPNEPGCRIPAEILAEFGLKPIQAAAR